ncbi:M48 family metalloprotease, partial [bacterium]|nr:M48 family metalloprotease [bacterium]
SLFMTFAGVLLGSIVIISELFVRGLYYGGGSSRRFRSSGSSRGGGQLQVIIMIAAVVFAILAPIIAQLLYFAISRRREYLADASAARLTRYPDGLASALEKISSCTDDLTQASKATAPLFIVNPLKKQGMQLSNLTSTHPPIDERVNILRAMSHGASLVDYQQAYDKVRKSKSPLIPPSGLASDLNVPIRKPHQEKETSKKDKQRGLGDVVRAMNQFIFLTCLCGLKLKIPPEYKKETVSCPRCQHVNRLPKAQLATIAALASTLENEVQLEESKTDTKAESKLEYKRTSDQWETFSCACGRNLQLSPAFEGDHLTCGSCGKDIKILK